MPIHSKAEALRRTRHNASKAGFGREFQVIIDKERCKGCGFCVKFCPKGVLKLSSSLNSIGYYPAMVESPEKCKGCGICSRDVCPESVIELYKLLKEESNEKVNDRQ